MSTVFYFLGIGALGVFAFLLALYIIDLISDHWGF